MKHFVTFHLVLGVALVLISCNNGQQLVPDSSSETPVEEGGIAGQTATPASTDTPVATSTPTKKPTLTPTATLSPTPTPAPKGGGNGYGILVVDDAVVKVSVEDMFDFNFAIEDFPALFDMTTDQMSGFRRDAISPDGKILAYWNCATLLCDTEQGPLYIYSTGSENKTTSVEVRGDPSFAGWSVNYDRLLYYLGSTMSDDFYMIKTKDPGFGELIPLGRVSAVSWAPDRKSIYTQKGNVVSQLDLDGKELGKWTCNFNNACMAAPSPDGKRFAGIQKYVPTSQGNPVITITNKDFTEKKTIFISEEKALIIGVNWLPDNQHLMVYGQTARQRLRRFWRLDYLSVMDVETGEERRIDLKIPEESESFYPCDLSPDGKYLFYVGVEDREKYQGRIYFNSRYANLLPLDSEDPELERLTMFEYSWESCPTWMVDR